jgi:hypothetical protein
MPPRTFAAAFLIAILRVIFYKMNTARFWPVKSEPGAPGKLERHLTMKTTTPLFCAALLLGAAINSMPLHAAQKPKTVASRSWVTLKASTDKKRYTPGEKIIVRLTATNTAKRGAYLRFTSGQRFDFSVYPVSSKESVYTWSATRMFMQSLGSLWLKPGQSQSYEETIGTEMGELKPGKYRLRAHLTNSPRPIEAAPIEFEIAASGHSLP